MRKIYDINQAAKACANDEDIIFVITKKNKYSILKFGFLQYKYHTNKEFKHISYEKPKDLFYYFLRFISKISFGHYKLTYGYKTKAIF